MKTVLCGLVCELAVKGQQLDPRVSQPKVPHVDTVGRSLTQVDAYKSSHVVACICMLVCMQHPELMFEHCACNNLEST